MSIDISISHQNINCNDIINKLYKCNIESRVIETTSVFKNSIEKGCLVTLPVEYSDQKLLSKVWNEINNNLNCAHIKIGSSYDGCILNYLNYKDKYYNNIKPINLCPHSE
ncbi:hypothetical protein ceV_507 [Chrysochromulina ericina virus CeV-01B]|uniref:Uncharacterized protein n=1 Tax=Chrysochromulina ericina virus CeV-01B TaxID=3070830 RepID=A0A0N9R1T6_9VIRU|nr:hypothetical protein ceV_507 [Chrysochromulina ericina virus]ALH23413.1 hypothetical protein ceV_507 [Chrysochromulina ericina virus CeV-01B]|tara:strand:- start:283 stop:612 length:330 start_codon:yes stop_codon:yes gene_type:complete